MKKLTLIFLCFANCAFGQSNFKENSIGLAYVNGYEGVEKSYMAIDIVFPLNYLHNISEAYPKNDFQITTDLKIYNVSNSFLLVDTTGTFNFKMTFWCENDGGIQYRPTTTLKIDTS